jgi:hypothetical protein
MENIYTGDPDIYLARIDLYGDTIWTRTYVIEYEYDHAYDVLQCYDGGFTSYSIYQAYSMCLSADNHYILCGRFQETIVSPIDHAWLFEVDSNSNLGWNYTYGASDSTIFASDVKMTGDGRIIARKAVKL